MKMEKRSLEVFTLNIVGFFPLIIRKSIDCQAYFHE